MQELTQARLKEALEYNPQTGIFLWRISIRNGVGAGKIAGFSFKRNLRWIIGIDGKSYFRSRLAWLYMTGQWPKAEVDHINRDKFDDRWSNLRSASRGQNNANRAVFKNNRSRHKGVHFRADVGKFRAMISFGGRNRCLGHFDTADEAGNAYLAAATQLFGAFAAAA